ncbi:MucBP domain-containing protein, partial [Pseudolactococcus plantarum]
TVNGTITYLDESGNTLLPSKAVPSQIGGTFNFSVAEPINGYQLDLTKSKVLTTINGSLQSITIKEAMAASHIETLDAFIAHINQQAIAVGVQNVELQYVYTKDAVSGGDITVSYEDESGHKLAEDMIQSGNVGDSYTTEAKHIPGHTFKSIIGNATGQFTADAQSVTYVYTKDAVSGGDITVSYEDENGHKLAEDMIQSGNVGDSYTTEAKHIPGHTFKSIIGNATGQFTADAQSVTYIYTKDAVSGGDITVSYEDESGHKLAEDMIQSGNVGDSYTTEAKHIAGHTLKSIIGNATGHFTADAQSVTYVYTKDAVSGGDITVSYEDENGHKLAEDMIQSGNVGDSYTTEAKHIPGHTFKSIIGNATGQFTADAQSVTYVYTKDAVSGGDITVSYEDESGHKLAEDMIQSGNVGDSYTTEAKHIAGHTFKSIIGNATGQFTADAQSVTYVYTKDAVSGGDITVSYEDESGHKLSEDMIKSGNVGDSYTTEAKHIPGHTFKAIIGNATGQFIADAQSVTYVYTKDAVSGGDITVSYEDESGHKLAEDMIQSGNVGDSYTTEVKHIPGHTFKSIIGNATGQFTADAQSVTYVYTKDAVNPKPNSDNKNDVSPTTNGLPKTGENNIMMLLTMMSGMILVMMGVVGLRLKKNKK